MAKEDRILDGKRWETLPARNSREEVVPYKRRVRVVPLIEEPYGVRDDIFFSTMNRTDWKAMKHLGEKLGVVQSILFGNRETPQQRVLKSKSDSPESGFEKANPKPVNNRHYRPDHPRLRNEEFLEALRVFIADIRWKTRGIFYSEWSGSDTTTKGRRIIPSMKPEPEVMVDSPEVKIVKPESGPPVSLPFGLRTSPELW